MFYVEEEEEDDDDNNSFSGLIKPLDKYVYTYSLAWFHLRRFELIIFTLFSTREFHLPLNHQPLVLC